MYSSPRSAEFYIVDILIAANKVKRYTTGFDTAQSLMHHEMAWDAVIRELEVMVKRPVNF